MKPDLIKASLGEAQKKHDLIESILKEAHPKIYIYEGKK